jgi:hypothetical protein
MSPCYSGVGFDFYESFHNHPMDIHKMAEDGVAVEVKTAKYWTDKASEQ